MLHPKVHIATWETLEQDSEWKPTKGHTSEWIHTECSPVPGVGFEKQAGTDKVFLRMVIGL